MRWLAAHLAAMDMYARDHRGSMPADDLREVDARLRTWLDEGHHRHRVTPAEEQELTTAYADRERARRGGRRPGATGGPGPPRRGVGLVDTSRATQSCRRPVDDPSLYRVAVLALLAPGPTHRLTPGPALELLWMKGVTSQAHNVMHDSTEIKSNRRQELDKEVLKMTTRRSAFERPIRAIMTALAAYVPDEQAIPGDRSGQIDLLKESGLFGGIELDRLADAQVELACLILSQATVVAANQAQVAHDDHNDLALTLEMSFGPTRRLTLVALPCGVGDVSGLQL